MSYFFVQISLYCAVDILWVLYHTNIIYHTTAQLLHIIAHIRIYLHKNRDVSIRVLGFWWWWLFVVPSLRSRRPTGPEKKALDIAFLGTPLISIIAPIVTKDTGLIWGANFAVVAACYAFSFATENEDDDDDDDSNQPGWLKFIYKSLDFGSGRERGARQ